MSNPVTEIELKLALVPADHLPRLLSALPQPREVVDQHNVYVRDPAGLLADQRVMLRVRGAIDADTGTLRRVRLTVKRRKPSRGQDEDTDVLVAEEREADVPIARWQALRHGTLDPMTLSLPPLAFLRDELGVTRTERVGVMVNRRHVVPWNGFILEVDRTEFPGGRVEAEIEVETDHDRIGEARQRLQELAAKIGVKLQPQPLGKFSRFRSYCSLDMGGGSKLG